MRSRLVAFRASHPAVFEWTRGAYIAVRDAGAPLTNRLPGALRVSSHGRENTFDLMRTRELTHVRATVNGDRNTIVFDSRARLRECSISIEGSDNEVFFGASSAQGCQTIIRGNGNRVLVGAGCSLRGLEIFCEDDGNTVSLSDDVEVHGLTELAAIEGTAITIGSDCLLAERINVRTGDSHAILDLAGVRINPSRSVTIGDHVWIGMAATVLKGVTVLSSCVVAASAVVTKPFHQENCVIGGHPATVIREGIKWNSSRGAGSMAMPEPHGEL